MYKKCEENETSNTKKRKPKPRKINVGNLLIDGRPDNWVAIYFTEKRELGKEK
jgi:hypothetical protein